MTIPIDETKWHRVDPWPGTESLPKGHKIEITRSDGIVIARITGPHAHVFADGPDFDSAIRAALDWLAKVGGEL